jgi:hypothetical protein
MDTKFLRELMDEIVRLNIIIHETKKERDDISKKYDELLITVREKDRLLRLNLEKERHDLKTKGISLEDILIVDQPVGNNTEEVVDEKESINEVATVNNVLVNNVSVNQSDKVVEIAEDSVEKRRMYMREYMKKKREAKKELNVSKV